MTTLKRSTSRSKLLKSRFYFRTKLPAPRGLARESLLIYDLNLWKQSAPFRKWSRAFARRYGVHAGERLKAIESWPRHIKKIVALTVDSSKDQLRVISVGGDSVADFTGFVASTLKGGVSFVHFPSTWLSVMDATRGGRVALHAGRFKNAVGAHHPPEEIHFVKELLDLQSDEIAEEALSKLISLALVDGGPWSRELAHSTRYGAALLWKMLPQAVEAFYRIEDVRLLGLGRSVALAFEKHFKWGYGRALGEGLRFAVRWSLERKELSQTEFGHITDRYLRKLVRGFGGKDKAIPWLSFGRTLNSKDARAANPKLEIVFLKAIGSPIIKKVSLRSIVNETWRQGYLS